MFCIKHVLVPCTRLPGVRLRGFAVFASGYSVASASQHRPCAAFLEFRVPSAIPCNHYYGQNFHAPILLLIENYVNEKVRYHV